MTVFSAACDAIFADPNIAVDAVWYPCSGGAGLPCRIILARPDVLGGFGEAQIVSDTLRLDVRVSQISAPVAGDRVVIDGDRFNLQGDPRRDRRRLVWQCEAVPE